MRVRNACNFLVSFFTNIRCDQVFRPANHNLEAQVPEVGKKRQLQNIKIIKKYSNQQG